MHSADELVKCLGDMSVGILMVLIGCKKDMV